MGDLLSHMIAVVILRPLCDKLSRYLLNIINSLKCNCSGRSLKIRFNEESLSSEFDKYNPSDGNYLRDFALKNLNVDLNTEKYLSLFKKGNNFKNKLRKVIFIILSSEFYHCIRHPRHLLWRIKNMRAQ